MIPSLMKNPLLLRVACMFRVLSWLPLIKHTKFSHIVEGDKTIPPKKFIPGIALLLLFVAELLEGWNAYWSSKPFLTLIQTATLILEKIAQSPDLKNLGYVDKFSFLAANVLEKKEVLCFIHVYVMMVILFAMSMLMSWRWWSAHSRPTPGIIFVLSLVLGGCYLHYNDVASLNLAKYSPLAGLLIREYATTWLDTAQSHQAWYLVSQIAASLLTFFTLYQSVMKRIEKGRDMSSAESALFTVIFVSVSFNIGRLLKRRQFFPLVSPLLCAGVFSYLHYWISSLDAGMASDRLRHLASLGYAGICFMTILSGATTMFVPFFGLLQLMITMHRPDMEKLIALR